MRANYGGGTPSGHGLKKFDGGAGSNKAVKNAFRTRGQDASANGNGHNSPHKPSPGPKAKGNGKW